MQPQNKNDIIGVWHNWNQPSFIWNQPHKWRQIRILSWTQNEDDLNNQGNLKM